MQEENEILIKNLKDIEKKRNDFIANSVENKNLETDLIEKDNLIRKLSEKIILTENENDFMKREMESKNNEKNPLLYYFFSKFIIFF